MKEKEYRRLKSQIEDEYKKKIDALELVWKMSNESDGSNGTEKSRQVIGKGTLQKAVRQVLFEIKGEFDIHDVERRIKHNAPSLANTVKRASLSSAIKRLVGTEIEVVSIGSGKRPSRYRKRE